VELARERKKGLVLTHDNPDPDSLASALGLAFVLEKKAGLAAKVAYGGIVGRAENRALLKVLKLPVVPVSKVVFDEYDFIALVDTQPECGNHSLLPQVGADAVIDHHPARGLPREVAFADVGGDYGATASIVTSYVRAAGLAPPPALATALFYGIKSDTRDLGREFEPVDVDNYHWLFPFVDHVALSQIEHPRLPPSYFAALHRAIGRARRHGEAVVADLDQVYAPDIVAEAADRLLSLEDTRWSLVLGTYEGQLYLSVRTSDRRMNAGRMVRELLERFEGSAGGHGSMAGGRIAMREGSAKEKRAFRQKIVRAFLREFGAPAKGQRLVDVRE
jgi:nanoRNase/pAp phosphatase (c-di-AMP/oligoRNAs hydrolase)